MGTPNSALTPSEASVLEDAIASALIDVHVMLPGKVQSYDATTRTADIELQLKRTLPTDETVFTTETMPILPGVPVSFPTGGGMGLTLPLKSGDTGMVVFSEQSIDQWRALNSVTSPGEPGRHTLTGGVFVPGLLATALAVAALTDGDNLSLGSQLPAPIGVQVVVKSGPPDTLHLGSKSAGEAILLGDTFLNAPTIPLVSSGYNLHKHSSAFGPTGPPLEGAPLTALSLRVFSEL